jgi:hypothetical protein
MPNPDEMSEKPDYQKIIDYILRKEHVELEEIRKKKLGISRKRELVFTRQLCMFFARGKTKASLAAIGTYMNRDHATVLHAVKNINNLSDTEMTTRLKVATMDAMIAIAIKYDFQQIRITVPIYELKEVGQTTITVPEGSETTSVLCIKSALIGTNIATVDQQDGCTIIYIKKTGEQRRVVV